MIQVRNSDLKRERVLEKEHTKVKCQIPEVTHTHTHTHAMPMSCALRLSIMTRGGGRMTQ